MENLTLLVNGTTAFPELISAIEHATTSVEINMFIWRDDIIGNRMAEAVLMAANHGVKVSISIDRYGVVLEKSEESKKSFFHKTLTFTEKVQVATLEVLYPKNGPRGKVKDQSTDLYRQIMNHPNIHVHSHEFKADHSKYYIIDDQILFLGGINIEDKENGCDFNGRAYGDYMVKLSGAHYVTAFREKLQTGANTLDRIYFGINHKKAPRQFEMEQLYLNLIQQAKTELHITMAYFSPLKQFMTALIDAHKRGVRITIVIPAHANLQSDSNRRTMGKLLKATNGEINVYLSPNMLHTKLIMNEQYISLGSTNINKKAFCQLDEVNLFVPNTNSTFVSALKESVRNDINKAQLVKTAEEIKYNRLLAFFECFVV